MSANAGSGQPSATIGKPSRRSTVATVRAASGLSAVRKFRQAAPPERGQAVANTGTPRRRIPASRAASRVRPVSGSEVPATVRRACQRATVRQSPPSASRPALDRTRRPFDRWPRRRPLPMIPATVRPLQPFAPVSGSEVATIERGQAVATVCRRIPANVAGFFPPCAQPLAVRLAIAATVRVSPA